MIMTMAEMEINSVMVVFGIGLKESIGTQIAAKRRASSTDSKIPLLSRGWSFCGVVPKTIFFLTLLRRGLSFLKNGICFFPLKESSEIFGGCFLLLSFCFFSVCPDDILYETVSYDVLLRQCHICYTFYSF